MPPTPADCQRLTLPGCAGDARDAAVGEAVLDKQAAAHGCTAGVGKGRAGAVSAAGVPQGCRRAGLLMQPRGANPTAQRGTRRIGTSSGRPSPAMDSGSQMSVMPSATFTARSPRWGAAARGHDRWREHERWREGGRHILLAMLPGVRHAATAAARLHAQYSRQSAPHRCRDARRQGAPLDVQKRGVSPAQSGGSKALMQPVSSPRCAPDSNTTVSPVKSYCFLREEGAAFFSLSLAAFLPSPTGVWPLAFLRAASRASKSASSSSAAQRATAIGRCSV